MAGEGRALTSQVPRRRGKEAARHERLTTKALRSSWDGRKHRDPLGLEAGRVISWAAPMRLTRRKSRFKAPATVHFDQARNEKGHKQLCVYAQCQYGGAGVGPVWSHTDQAVRRALATLSKQCNCGRPFHFLREATGHRVLPEGPRPR